ncbi:MAG: radical SAM protein [Deltaproteobacteria bacterium]|nr:radical SAM protein [Deltaproteobacteria bacterium]MBW2067522.1 radical SAM protein [Deltaproteobacteria bacterium]
MQELISYPEYEKCRLCPWECCVDRSSEELGKCRAPADLRLNDAMLHFGEEACLVGSNGSGALFLACCTLRCVYCQTWEISWEGKGIEISTQEFIDILKDLVRKGAENLNFITPTHYVPHIRFAIKSLREDGITVPTVYNTSSFERVETLRSLEGYIDIYLADFKYWDSRTAEMLSGCQDYPDVAKRAIKEMHKQVGDLTVNEKGVAQKGLLVRHLVLPGFVEESVKIVEWIAENLSTNTYINIMGHYRPCHKAKSMHELNRTLMREEFETVVQHARNCGLHRIDTTHWQLYPYIWTRSDNVEET